MPKVSGLIVPKLFPGSKAFAKLLKKKVGEMVMGYRRFTDEVAEILKTAMQF